MTIYTIREIGRMGGYITHDVDEGKRCIATAVTFLDAETIVKDLLAPGDTYREEYLGGGGCELDYTQIRASWAKTAKWDRGED